MPDFCQIHKVDNIIVILTMEIKTVIRNLDLYQENGQKDTATVHTIIEQRTVKEQEKIGT